MKNLNLRGIVVGPVMTNCYFLKNTQSGETLVVTPQLRRSVSAVQLTGIRGKTGRDTPDPRTL